MRISDWSSDVCSSDLDGDDDGEQRGEHGRSLMQPRDGARLSPARPSPRASTRPASARSRPTATAAGHPRSEEHTSELQSLMRISYAVFCLKKNNTTTQPAPKAHESTTYNKKQR